MGTGYCTKFGCAIKVETRVDIGYTIHMGRTVRPVHAARR